jgi:hypothetical protein
MDGSLRSRTIALEVDSSSGQLGHRTPHEIAEGHQRAAELDLYGWGVRADVVSIQPGVFDGHPSCIIAFEFRFKFNDNGSSSSRFCEAKITTTLDASPTIQQPQPAESYPVIKMVSPFSIEGPVTL